VGVPELFHGAYCDYQILKFSCKQLYYAAWQNSGIQLFILFRVCDCVLQYILFVNLYRLPEGDHICGQNSYKSGLCGHM
jgi:hypothetical protein